MLFLALATAVLLRFYQLGQLPPGLYRDEAYNGLDALAVLDGHHTLFFPANNGREPLYIYLTAGAVALFGRSAFSLRFAAALISSLTTILTYKLAKSWFGWRVGLLSAWLWAITLWPIHLGRIGFRVVLLPFFLALIFWLATVAYRRANGRLWLLAGMVYGLSFYSYLAIRFTPLLLLLLAAYYVLSQRQNAAKQNRQLPLAHLLLFSVGTILLGLPLLWLALQEPTLILGRTGQVSIWDGAGFLPALWQHTKLAFASFLGQGDTILRHNPAGRPIFDFVMALPFLIGVGWCLRHWRRAPAGILLLWTAVMLGPTILSTDTPHFLRAAGILPAAIIFPAIGLNWLWQQLAIREWRITLTPPWRSAFPTLLIATLLLASLLLTLIDYRQYSHDPETAYLFEAAASQLAADIQKEAATTVVFVDNRFWSGWPSLPFLVDEAQIVRFQATDGFAGLMGRDTAVYAWPHESLNYLQTALPPPALISSQIGPLARGDLEASPYPLYVRYHAQPAPNLPVVANFDNQLQLRQATVTTLTQSQVQIDLYWSAETAVTRPLVVFIHILDADGLVAQDDAPPANGRWSWWQPGLIIQDSHIITLPAPLADDLQILIGLYDANSQARLPVHGTTADTWQLRP